MRGLTEAFLCCYTPIVPLPTLNFSYASPVPALLCKPCANKSTYAKVVPGLARAGFVVTLYRDALRQENERRVMAQELHK